MKCIFQAVILSPVGKDPVVQVLVDVPVLGDEVWAELLPTGVEQTEHHNLHIPELNITISHLSNFKSFIILPNYFAPNATNPSIDGRLYSLPCQVPVLPLSSTGLGSQHPRVRKSRCSSWREEIKMYP